VTGPGVDPVFAALADPTRRDVLRAVTDRPDVTATELALDLPVSRQAVVKHLQALAGAGLVAAERHGREQRYRATPAGLGDALAWLVEAGAAWDDRLERLRRRVEG
jgi:DNA-binding transcriptional ArsR family regulator